VVLLLQLVAPALVLFDWDDGAQVGVGETLELLLQARPSLAQVVAAGLQFLGQPGTALGTLQCRGDVCGVHQEIAQGKLVLAEETGRSAGARHPGDKFTAQRLDLLACLRFAVGVIAHHGFGPQPAAC
jgi:hypothetical protein